MNITHLKYAVEVEKTGSITKAADNLFMGQPNLSKAIKELELAMGTAIFKRTPKGVVPTKKGTEFLTYAKSILTQIDEMEALYTAKNLDKISFGISVPRANYISHAFAKFASSIDSEKGMDLNFKETSVMQVINDIAGGEYNLGIIRYQLAHENYFLDLLHEKNMHFDIIWEYQYVALMSKKHPLAPQSEVSFDELSKNIEIIYGDIETPDFPLEKVNITEPYGDRRIYVFDRGSQFDILNNVATSFMWVSPLPSQVLKRYGLVQRKCNAINNKYKDVVIYNNGYRLTDIDKSFLSTLVNVKNEIFKTKYI